MILRRLWRRSRSFFHNKLGEGVNGIISIKAFKIIIQREIVRSDRNEHEFSLVLFEISTSNNNETWVNHLIENITKRMRCTDEVGRYDENQIGVILPDTPAKGAKKYAHDVAQHIAANGRLQPVFRIYTYPYQGLNGRNGREISNEQRYQQPTLFPDPSSSQKKSLTQLRTDPSISHYCGEHRGNLLRASSEQDQCILSCYKLPIWKRMTDVLLALILLIICLPVFPVTAFLIKLVSPGPIFLKQERIGVSGTPFQFWKFRTMNVNADPTVHRQYVQSLIQGDQQKIEERPMEKLDSRDTQIIPFGRLLRKTYIDELPQLINVLQGNMSLVGPRPCLGYEYEKYSRWHTQRFESLPGMTGLWQVSGKNKKTFSEMIRLDIQYSRNQSFWQDLKILLKTLPSIIGQIYR